APAADDDPARVEFRSYSPGTHIAVTYVSTGDHKFYGLIVETWKRGQQTRCDIIDRDEKTALLEEYRYRGKSLHHIKTVATAPGEFTVADYDIVYDKVGALLGIKQDGIPLYWNPEKVPKLPVLHKKISQRLVEFIPTVVRRAAIKEKAWCVA